MASLRSSVDGDDMFSPSSSMRGSAEPMRRVPSPSPIIDFDSIDDPSALKALLKAREEKMRTLEKRVEIAQGAKNKLKERYTEKIEMLEQLVMALVCVSCVLVCVYERVYFARFFLTKSMWHGHFNVCVYLYLFVYFAQRRKLQTTVDGGSEVEGGMAQRVIALEKQNDGLKEMVSVQKQQVVSARAQSAKHGARGAGGPASSSDFSVLSKMEEKVQELTAALHSRTRENKAQMLLLEEKELKIFDLQTAVVNTKNTSSSPEAGLNRKVQQLNTELEEARSMGSELQRQRDRFSTEYESLHAVVQQQQLEKDHLQRDNATRATQLAQLQKERERQIMETEEMHRMVLQTSTPPHALLLMLARTHRLPHPYYSIASSFSLSLLLLDLLLPGWSRWSHLAPALHQLFLPSSYLSPSALPLPPLLPATTHSRVHAYVYECTYTIHLAAHK